MKIGILTYHWVYNFGANLQTLSTVGYFRKHGYDPVVINWIPADLENYYDKTTSPEMVKVFRDFQKEYYPLTRLCRDSKDVAEVIKDEGIEMVFLGADTLFKLRKPTYDRKTGEKIMPSLADSFPNPFWGEFLNYVDVPIVGYSIATNQTDYKDYLDISDKVSRYIKRFKKLTVRDEYTQSMVAGFTKNEVIPSITPDPVFGFNENVNIIEKEKDIIRKFELPSDYYLLCMPQPFHLRLKKWAIELKQVIEKDGSKLFELPRQNGGQCFDIPQLKYQHITPLEWYVIIKNSKGYIGGLMHPIVSCIHNKVPFYSLDYYGVAPRVFGRKIRGLGLFMISKESSKTFQIVKDCGLLNFYFNINNRLAIFPSPSTVYDKLKGYDFAQLKKASEYRLTFYEETVKEILS